MKTSPFYLWACLFLLTACVQEKGATSFPPYPQAEGVSAPFAGFMGDTLIVAGGCNFPDTPAAKGGKKKFYPSAYAIDVRQAANGWKPLAPLPAPLAYGACVSTPKGLVCIGGQNDQGAQAGIFLLNAQGNATALPPLPASIDNGGAALSGHTVYATGGNQPDGGKALYALGLNADTLAWTRLADYPGPQRVQPIVIAGPNTLYLIGGFAFDADTKVCTPSTDMLHYDISSDSWSQLDTLVSEQDGTPRCLAGGSGVLKNNKLILTGGVNHDIFRQAMEGKGPADYMKKPAEWYRFNDDLLVYDLDTRTWEVTYDVSGLARAGGILLEHEGLLYMICGETKPGIRTPQITVLPLGAHADTCTP